MKKDAFYFPHDSNAHQDPKLLTLRSECGYEGVGLFWTFVEMLRESSGYRYPYKLSMIALALGHPKDSVDSWLKHCLDIGLLLETDGHLTSPALTNRMELIDRRREIMRQAGRRGNESRWKDGHPIAKRSPGDHHPIASKVKERKEDKEGELLPTNPKKFVKPTSQEVTAYCLERSNSVDAESFVNFYDSKGWLIGKAPMKDWKAAVRTWEKNEFSAGSKKEVRAWDQMPSKAS